MILIRFRGPSLSSLIYPDACGGKFSTLCMLSIALLFLNGCQHLQLRRITTRQASTLSDLQYRQVLDNLAQCCDNPHALPHFAIPTGGFTQVDTNSEGSLGFEWDPSTLVGTTLGANGSRGTSGNWNLESVNEADKLRRMQCAYQAATGKTCTCGECRSCEDLFREFYGEAEYCCRMPRTGWFGVGRKRDVPKSAAYVGNHGSTYVWVAPENVAELSRLTHTILDFALRSPVPPEQAKVTYQIEDGVVKSTTVEVLIDAASVLPQVAPVPAQTMYGAAGAPVELPPSSLAPSGPRTLQDKGLNIFPPARTYRFTR